MSRILGLDWGSVRIGAAVSDTSGKIAFALKEAILAKEALNTLKNIIESLEIKKIIIGKPISLSGKESLSSDKSELFVQKLIKKFGLPVEQLDERFSTSLSLKMLKEQGIKTKGAKGLIDNLSAQSLLQRYLDRKK